MGAKPTLFAPNATSFASTILLLPLVAKLYPDELIVVEKGDTLALNVIVPAVPAIIAR